MYKELDIQAWASARKIHANPNPIGQLKKTAEEVLEAVEAIAKKDYAETYKELGDIYITWINACDALNVSPEYCIDQAFNKIKDREGEVVNGVFVKK